MENREVDEKNVITRTNLGVVPSTADEMDTRRRNTAVLDYLRKLDEAKEWITKPSNQSIDLATFLDEFPKGEWLAKIARSFDPEIKTKVYVSSKKEYLHTDNINTFLAWLKKIKLSRHFYFEVIDLYESKDIPKVIYCIHGLAHFLNLRGITAGINKSKSVFSDADRALIGSDIHKIGSHCYDDIENRLESEDETDVGGGNFSGSVNNSFVQDTSSADREGCVFRKEDAVPDYLKFPRECKTIRSFVKTYIWWASLNNIMKAGKVTVSAIRKFVGFDPQVNEEEQKLHELNEQIFNKFKENFAMQEEKDRILRSVRLLLENQCRLRQMEFQEYPLANDYRLFKRTLYNLLHDYELIYQMISDGYELPLRVFYPDNRIGDYYFSKLVEYILTSHDEQAACKIAAMHFMTSKVFKNLTSLFDNRTVRNSKIPLHGERPDADKVPEHSLFDLNPVNVSEHLYNELPKVSNDSNVYSKKAMLDEAIKDKKVREEIVRRADIIIDFVGERIDYMGKMDLPYYIRMFIKSKTFFEDFIEPAILLSNNFIISEIIKYIFYSKSLFDGETRVFEQERLTYYDCKVDRTSNFNFSDYSPLKDWLESEDYKSFYRNFLDKNGLKESINTTFLGCHPDSESMQVVICLEEVNNIIIVLKENVKLMNHIMGSMVSKMTLLRQQPAGCVKVQMDYDDSIQDCSESLDVVINGEAQKQDPVDSRADGRVYLMKEENEKAAGSKCTHVPKIDYFKEKFVLKLDTQFIDLENDARFAIGAVFNNLKTQIVLLISISTGSTLMSILNYTSEEEVARFEAISYPTRDLHALKKSVLDDLEFLSQKEIISRANGYQSILDMIAHDAVKSKCSLESSELRLNSDTLDALFKKGIMLHSQLEALYAYTNDLLRTMSVNRSGAIFNRQCAPRSQFGTYRYNLSVLRPVIFESIDLSNLKFTIASEQPLVYTFTVLHNGKPWQVLENVRFDELLRLQEDRIPCFDVNEIMTLNVREFIQIINEQYIRY